MQISRTHLYNKPKKLLNLSITEFINKIKIDVAKLKIIETNLLLRKSHGNWDSITQATSAKHSNALQE